MNHPKARPNLTEFHLHMMVFDVLGAAKALLVVAEKQQREIDSLKQRLHDRPFQRRRKKGA